MLPNRSLTTGRVAALCQVAPRTVSKWFDSGRLKGYRIPGSQDRRIPEECFRRFLIAQGMPDWMQNASGKSFVLLLAEDNDIHNSIVDSLSEAKSVLAMRASNSFELGLCFAHGQPDILVVSDTLATKESLLRLVRRQTMPYEPYTLVLCERDATPSARYQERIDFPFDPDLLSTRLFSLVMSR